MKNKISICTSALIILSLGALQISNAKDRSAIQQADPIATINAAAGLAEAAKRDAELAEAAAERAMQAAFDIFSDADKATATAKLAKEAASNATKAAEHAADTAEFIKGCKEILVLKAAKKPEQRIYASAAEEDDFYDNYDYREQYDWPYQVRLLLEKTARYAEAAIFFRTDAEKAAAEAVIIREISDKTASKLDG